MRKRIIALSVPSGPREKGQKRQEAAAAAGKGGAAGR
jgi:hypothetical protein